MQAVQSLLLPTGSTFIIKNVEKGILIEYSVPKEEPKMEETSTVMVMNLPPSIRVRDLEEAFGRYGRLEQVKLKSKKHYAFVRYEDERDAADAVDGMNGKTIGGQQVRVVIGNRVPLVKKRQQRTIRVSNVDPSVTVDDLDELFSNYGDINFIDHEGWHFYLIDFQRAQQATEAVEGENGVDLNGSKMKVELAE